MTSNNINLLGIDDVCYYFLNPLFVRINSTTKFVTKATFKLTNTKASGLNGNDLTTATFNLQSNPEGVIYVDIAEYIKSISIYANGYKAKTPKISAPNSLNDITIVATVYTREDTSPTVFNFTKLFLLGYKMTQDTNISVDTSSLLNLENSPFYKFPNSLYTNLSLLRTSINGRDLSTVNIAETNINILNHVTVKNCNTLCLRFLNSLGGYEHVVFSNYAYSTQSSVSDVKIKILRFLSNKVSHIDKLVNYEKEYTATQEFDIRFAGFIDELIRSQYVQVMFDMSGTWLEVDMQANSMPQINNQSFELGYKFKLLTSTNI